MTCLTADQWSFYDEHGYVKLGKLLSDAELRAMQQRIDDIMLGRAAIDYSKLLMQLDSETGKYEDAGQASKGHKGARLDYRKIQDLEHDDLFLSYMQRPIFQEICARLYGVDEPIAIYRAMFMNKPAHRGTFLAWHQDRWPHLDRDPLITTWTALDPATIANGCVQVIPGSHKLGIVNPQHDSGYLRAEQARQYCDPSRVVYLELQPGEVVLLHNWLMHASDINRTGVSRRAFSVCYMHGKTCVRQTGATFPQVFGPAALRSLHA